MLSGRGRTRVQSPARCLAHEAIGHPPATRSARRSARTQPGASRTATLAGRLSHSMMDVEHEEEYPRSLNQLPFHPGRAFGNEFADHALPPGVAKRGVRLVAPSAARGPRGRGRERVAGPPTLYELRRGKQGSRPPCRGVAPSPRGAKPGPRRRNAAPRGASPRGVARPVLGREPRGRPHPTGSSSIADVALSCFALRFNLRKNGESPHGIPRCAGNRFSVSLIFKTLAKPCFASGESRFREGLCGSAACRACLKPEH